MYKTHAMAICHGGTGGPIDSDINLYIEGAEGINTGLINDDESTKAQTLQLLWEDLKQKVTPVNSYPASRPSWQHSWGKEMFYTNE